MKKAILSILLAIGLVGFFTPLVMILAFDMDYDGIINNDVVEFLICFISLYMIIGGCIGLYQLSDRFKVVLKVIGRCFAEWL